MKLGELFVQLGVKGNTDKLDKTIKQMEEVQARNKDLIKYRKDLTKATSESEKALVKKNFADKIQLDNLKKQQVSIKQNQAGWVGLAKGVLGFIGVATLAYKTMDRMITSLAQANQQMITFQRTSGISFASLNKYASANAAVNFNSSIEGTAQTMSRLASNLYDIRMGRGDISPYQELAFVGGKAFNPMGMSVEQLIENVREAIKGVDDVQATNIIQRMGFAPDDLLMLRMSREEFEKINDLFLSSEQREKLNKYSLELKKINLQFQKTGQSILIDLAEPFIKLATIIERLFNLVYKGFIKPVQLGFKVIGSIVHGLINGVKALSKALVETFNILKPIFSILKMIGEIIWLPIEDVLTYLAGGDSMLGMALEGLSNVIDGIADKFKSLWSNFEPPDWVLKIMDWFNKNNNTDPVVPNERGEYMSRPEDKPTEEFMTPINPNKISNANTSNINTNNQFTINTNQPTERVAQGLMNAFTPAQVQFSAMAV